MRILWVSNAPWASTGYGNQTSLFVPRLRDLGHEIGIFAFYGLEGGIIAWDGIPVFPRGLQPYGQDIWSAHAHDFGADCAISLIDAWVYGIENNPHGIPWVPWFPVDSEPLGELMTRKLAQAQDRIVFSRFAERQCKAAGLDCFYVPHGIDAKAFHPVDQAQARKAIGLPEDVFLIGMVAANKGQPSRKAFQQHLEAFAELKKKHSDTMMYLHTTRTTEYQGMDIPAFIRFLGLREGVDVVFCDPYRNHIGFNTGTMNLLYNSFDVHALVSMGEGFGIPIVEAQAAGCPVIVGDWTAMSELCFSGWKVPKSEATAVYMPTGNYQYIVKPQAVYERFLAAYEMRGNRDYRSRARDGALQYDADKVTEKYWKPVLEKVGQRLTDNAMDIRKVAE